MAVFVEIGRVGLEGENALIVSKVVTGKDNVKGLSLNRYISTPSYTGPCKGVMVPMDKVSDIIKILEGGK